MIEQERQEGERGGRGAITLVVPLYNEHRRFHSFAPRLAEFIAQFPRGSELVFVDDGSTDGTDGLAEGFVQRAVRREQRVRLVRCPHRGKGAAVRTGLETAVTPIAGFCDLDLSTPLTDFRRLVDAAVEAPILVIASRGLAASRLTRHQGRTREFLGRTFNKIVQLTIAPGIVDTQCGAKVASTDLWRGILPFSREHGFAWDVEVIAIALRLGFPVQEVAVEWRHEDESKVRVARDGLAMLRGLARIRNSLVTQIPGENGAADFIARHRPEAEHTRGGADTHTTAGPGHWSLRSKASFVDWALKERGVMDGRLVGLGGRAGDVVARLGWPPDDTIVADDNAGRAGKAHRRYALEVVCCDLDRVPITNGTARVVCAVDVLQRAADPGPIVREARRLLHQDGQMIVIVPADAWQQRGAEQHRGRSRSTATAALRIMLEAEGFEMLFCSHVFSWLPMLSRMQRRRGRNGAMQPGMEIDTALVDRGALFLSRLERVAMRWISLPIGASVLCIARAAARDGE